VSSTAGSRKRIAVIGGTGKEGGGLALRWAQAGYAVVIGSRAQDKAEQAAAEFDRVVGGELIRGANNADAAAQAEIVVVCVPYTAHKDTLQSIAQAVQGKIVVDVTVPIQPPHFSTVTLPQGRTAAQEAQALLGAGVRIVSAFQNVSAIHLKDLSHPPNCDVLISGDDPQAKQEVAALAEAAGMRGIDVGPLANAIVAESLTPILVAINKRYGVKGAGIRITGIDDQDTHAKT
jgi:hypothetical protein